MRPTLEWLSARAESVAAAMLAAMFAAFIVQIVSRYVLGAPVGWTLEFCLMMWLWIVFWGSAFCLRDRDHVKFDIFYASAPGGVRRTFAIASALAIIVGFLASLPATWDYVTFLRIKKSSTMRIRLDYVFSIYLIFMAAVIVRYAIRALRLVRRGAPEATHGGIDP